MALVDFSLGDIGGVFKDIREAITGEAITDPNKKAEIELKLAELENALLTGQMEINKAEASNPNWFVAGWRPFIGWVGGAALAYQFIVQPFIIWAASVFQIDTVPPTLDTAMLFNLILALLGISGMRTWEKQIGVNKKH